MLVLAIVSIPLLILYRAVNPKNVSIMKIGVSVRNCDTIKLFMLYVKTIAANNKTIWSGSRLCEWRRNKGGT